jgi:hypothetical protein
LTGKKLPLPLKPDKDGFIIGDDGVKRLAITNADAQSYAAYVVAKRRAAAANVELVILPDEAV